MKRLPRNALGIAVQIGEDRKDAGGIVARGEGSEHKRAQGWVLDEPVERFGVLGRGGFCGGETAGGC